MRILVLDSIHGGRVIADHLKQVGHEVDMVDIYRHIDGISEDEARERRYDLLTHPVHLDPEHPLLRTISSPAVTHHQIVRWLLAQKTHSTVIEITGAQGKTTTASALAWLMSGSGILHTSSGLIRYPEQITLGRYSITPASFLTALTGLQNDEWLVGEVSLGFCGIGDLGILTSGDDYLVASGKKRAIDLKTSSAFLIPKVIVPPGVQLNHSGCIRASDLVSVSGATCDFSCGSIKGSFTNPLLYLPGYKTPLMLVAAAALIMGISPEPLSSFVALPGRMQLIKKGSFQILDNANSGTCYQTTCDAARYCKIIEPGRPITLVIGQESSSVCENFVTEEICRAIHDTNPESVILIPGDPRIDAGVITSLARKKNIPLKVAESPEMALKMAESMHNQMIMLSYKRWR